MDPEASIVRDVFIYNVNNEEVEKQLCMETMSPGKALTFAVVRERGEMMYKRVIGGIPRFGIQKCNSRPNNADSSVADPG